MRAKSSIMCGHFCIGFIDFMLAVKNLIDYTSLFSPYDFDKNDNIILSCYLHSLCSSIEVTNRYSNLSDQSQFRLNEINKIKDYFNWEIQKQKLANKKLSKYITVFDYFDKALTVLSAASGGISIISFTSVIGVPVGMASASISPMFSVATEIIKTALEIRRNKKKKHDKIHVLPRNKLNSTENLISQALIDLEISYGEFKTIINEKEKYE